MVAYPDTPLPVKIEMYLGSSLGWVDITSYVFTADGGISISDGFPNEGTTPEPSKMTMPLKNTDGRFTPRNPLGAYYGLIGRNTPVRVSVGLARDTFDRTVSDGWGTSSDGHAWTVTATGTGTAADFDVANGSATMVVGTAAEGRRARLTGGPDFRNCEVRVTVDTSLSAAPSTASISVGIDLRSQDATNTHLCRVLMQTDGTVRLDIFVAGSSSAAGTLTEVPGLTYAGQPLRIAVAAVGTRFAMKVWDASLAEPLDWQLTATDELQQDAAPVGVRCGVTTGNTDVPVTFTFTDFEVRSTRAVGEVSEWPTRWDISGHKAWTSVTAQGVLRRLNQGQRPARSPLASVIIAAREDEDESGPLLARAYWPMEDSGGTSFASGLPGGTPLTVGGDVDVASDATAPGSLALPVFSATTTISGKVTGTFSSGRWSVSWATVFPSAPSSTTTLMEVTVAGGSAPLWCLTADASTVTWQGLTAAGGSVVHTVSDDSSVVYPILFGGDWVGLEVYVAEDLGEFGVVVYDLAGSGTGVSDTASVTAGTPTRVRIEPAAGLADMAMGHLTVMDGTTPLWLAPADGPSALNAFDGERAATRAARLCAEQDITFTLIGDADDTAAMGPQVVPSTFVDALTECWLADQGLLVESTGQLGLTMRTRISLYNQPVALELDYTADGETAPGLEPTDDDQLIRNDVTAKRRDGSSARSQKETGTLSVAEVGRYDEEIELNLYDDSLLRHVAAWRVHLGLDDQGRRHLARHEAGHAVLAVHFGLAIHHSTLTEGEGYGATLTAPAPDPWTDAVVAAGGMAATMVSSGFFTVTYPAAHDEQTIATLVGRQRIGEAVAEARRILDAHELALVAVADALHERGYLTGEEVVQIARSNGMQPSPDTVGVSYAFGSPEHLEALIAAHEAGRSVPGHDSALGAAGQAIVCFAQGGRVDRAAVEPWGVCVSRTFSEPRRNAAVVWGAPLATGTLAGVNVDGILKVYPTLRDSWPAFSTAAHCVENHRPHIQRLANVLRQRGSVEWEDMLEMFEPPSGAMHR